MKSTTRHLLVFLALLFGSWFRFPAPARAVIPLNDVINKQMSECLEATEYTTYLDLQNEYREMRSPGNVKISEFYQLKSLVKDDKGRALCDLPFLPDWVSHFCTARDLVDKIEQRRKQYVGHNLGNLYARYIQDHLDQFDAGIDPLKINYHDLPPELVHDPVLKDEHDQIKVINRMFKNGARAYYIKMRQMENRILEYRNRCMEVPNLIGMTYEAGTDESMKDKRFGVPMIQQDEFKNLHVRKREPLIIFKQFPPAGSFLKRSANIKVWVRNSLKSLKADPPSWPDAKVGDTKTFEITAELLNETRTVTAECIWSSTATGVVSTAAARGTGKATGPGTAEIVVQYRFNDGSQWTTGEVRIPVTVLAPVKPPKPEKKLLSFTLRPPSTVDIAIGDPPTPLRGFATFSDAPQTQVDVTRDCHSWRSDGTPDLTVTNGLVTAHSATLPPARHRIHGSYTFNGQTLSDSVLFRITGGGAGPGTGTPPPGNTPVAHYSKLTLSKTRIEMGPKSTAFIRAKVWVAHLSQLNQRDVTDDPNLSWSSSDSSVAEFTQGAVTSKTSAGTCVITATFTPPGGQTPLTASCTVTVKEQPMFVDFKVANPKSPYSAGQTLTFEEMIEAPDKTLLNLTWYVEGREIGTRSPIDHLFDEAGTYQVRLVARNRKTGVEDAMAKSITIEPLPAAGGETGDDGTSEPEDNPTVGTLGRYRNRFSTENERGDLQILSSYWRGGSGDWSKPIRFNGGRIGEVDHFILHNGIQADGYNTGFLVYVPRGRNEIRFRIFHFRWPENPKLGPSPQGFVHYEGLLPLHGKSIVPNSVRVERVASRLCDVGWRTTDGSACRARIAKFKKSGTIRYSGVEDLGCEEGVYPPVEPETDSEPSGSGPTDVSRPDEVPAATLSDRLVSGTYDVLAHPWRSQWRLNVNGGSINGRSQWSCCPGPRVDPMKGQLSGDTVSIERDCTGQGNNQPCRQVYSGQLDGNTIRGNYTYNGSPAGTWVLYLDSRSDADLSETGSTAGDAAGGDPDEETTDEADGLAGEQNHPQDSSTPADAGQVEAGTDGTDSGEDGGPDDGTYTEDADDLGAVGATGQVTEEDVQNAGGHAAGDESDSGGTLTGTDPLVGLWVSQDGHYIHIFKNDQWWEMVALENEGPVGWKKGTTGRLQEQRLSIIINSRVNRAEVSKDGTRLDWGNGNFWKLVNPSPTAAEIDAHSFHPLDLTGLWVSNGHEIRISRNGDWWEAVAQENQGPVGWKKGTAGRLNFWSFSIVLGNRAYSATVSRDGNRLDWGRDGVWTRKNPPGTGAPPNAGPQGSFIPYDTPTNNFQGYRYGVKKRP